MAMKLKKTKSSKKSSKKTFFSQFISTNKKKIAKRKSSKPSKAVKIKVRRIKKPVVKKVKESKFQNKKPLLIKIGIGVAAGASIFGIILAILSNITFTKIESYPVSKPYSTTYTEDDTMPAGDFAVVQEGKEGVINMEYEVTYRFLTGKEISRELISTTEAIAAVDEIIANGTKMDMTENTSPAASTTASKRPTYKTVMITKKIWSDKLYVDSHEDQIEPVVDSNYDQIEEGIKSEETKPAETPSEDTADSESSDQTEESESSETSGDNATDSEPTTNTK